MPFYIKLGRFAISSFGLMMSIGLLISYISTLRLSKYVGIIRSQIENVFLAAVFFGIFFGRVSYVIKNHDQIPNLISIFQIWNGGLDYYGTIIGVVVGVVAVAWFYNIPILKALDVASIIGSLTLGIGYISAGLVGFGFGRPVPKASDITPGFHIMEDFPFFYVVYKFGDIAPPSIPFYPVQFMYGVLFILFGIGLIAYVIKRSNTFPGEIFSIFLIAYGFINMVVGYYSMSHTIFGHINVEQFSGLLSFLVGLSILWLLKSEKQSYV